MTDLQQYLDLQWHIEVVHDPAEDETGGWAARVLELPGCIAQGDTLEELMVNVRRAIAAWIDDALREGEEIPVPEPDADPQPLELRVPMGLRATLEREAARQGVSVATLAAGLGWTPASDPVAS